MKYLSLFLAVAFLALSCGQKNSRSCCQAPNASDATAVFASLSDDAAFRNAHPSPETMSDTTFQGKMVAFDTESGEKGNGYLVSAAPTNTKYLLLFHEWWGLNDYIKKEADFWRNELDINVLAIDLYDGKVTNVADEAGKLMQANDPLRSAAIIAGAEKFIGPSADFRTMGWCFGGGWSLRAALQLQARTKACVIYYGMPEQDIEKLKTLQSDVLFIHPDQDKWISKEVVSDFEANMKKAGKRTSVHHYDTDHAFANPSSPRYNEQAAKEARAVVKGYLMGK